MSWERKDTGRRAPDTQGSRHSSRCLSSAVCQISCEQLRVNVFRQVWIVESQQWNDEKISIPGDPLRNWASSSMSSTLSGSCKESYISDKAVTYKRLALWSILTIFTITFNLSPGTLSHLLKAAIKSPRISLPGFDVMYVNGSSKALRVLLEPDYQETHVGTDHFIPFGPGRALRKTC